MVEVICEEIEKKLAVKIMKDQIKLIIDLTDENVVEIGTPTTKDFHRSYQRSRDVAIRYGYDVSGLPKTLNQIKKYHLKRIK